MKKRKYIILLVIIALLMLALFFIIPKINTKLNYSNDEIKNITLNINELYSDDNTVEISEDVDKERIVYYYNRTIGAFKGNSQIELDKNNISVSFEDDEYKYIDKQKLELYLIVYNYTEKNDLSVNDIASFLKDSNYENRTLIKQYINWYWGRGYEYYNTYGGYAYSIMKENKDIYGDLYFSDLSIEEKNELFKQVTKKLEDGTYSIN